MATSPIDIGRITTTDTSRTEISVGAAVTAEVMAEEVLAGEEGMVEAGGIVGVVDTATTADAKFKKICIFRDFAWIPTKLPVPWVSATIKKFSIQTQKKPL